MLCGVAMLWSGCGEPLPDDASGEEVYRATCAQCHGDELQGGGGLLSPDGPPLGPGSAAAGQPDEFYIQTITRGSGRMPAVRVLNEVQIERVITYIRERQEG